MSAESIVTFNSIGTSLATESTVAYGIASTLPTSLIAPLAAIVPNDIICATLSVPYLRTT